MPTLKISATMTNNKFQTEKVSGLSFLGQNIRPQLSKGGTRLRRMSGKNSISKSIKAGVTQLTKNNAAFFITSLREKTIRSKSIGPTRCLALTYFIKKSAMEKLSLDGFIKMLISFQKKI